MRIAVVGSSGFLGSAVAGAATQEGHVVVSIRAPRLTCAGRTASDVLRTARETAVARELVRELAGCHAVINAAGVSDAGAAASDALYGANSLLPAVLDIAARQAGVARFVHISSAAVQGTTACLTESADRSPFSAYSHSKAVGESVLADSDRAVVYRPTSVHGPGRLVTDRLVALASSRFSSVASPGDQPTPQVHVDSVGSAVVYVATCRSAPPKYVLHPWEGFTTSSLLELLGGRSPVQVPSRVAGAVLSIAGIASRLNPRVGANARRLTMLWLGQRQVPGWLAEAGWTTPVDRAGWAQIKKRQEQ